MRMSDVLGVILGGGKGTRLHPLTAQRSKPAVPLAGKYRLIDIPMSNCFHAGIDKVAILTQFNSASLHRHVFRTYNRDAFAKGWVQILAAEQTPLSGDWYQGTADAVRKQRVELISANMPYTLILAGDHLYRMDYEKLAEFHEESGADVTVAVLPVSREDATGFGILKLDDDNKIVEFEEKPKEAALLDKLVSNDNPDKPYMASMGIYLFRTSVLFDLLDSNSGDDFGHDIIPAAIDKGKVFGYPFEGYWEDIGTIRRFYEVNLQMAAPLPKFNLYDPERPIYTRPRFLPGSKVQGGTVTNVLLSDGCRVQDATIRYSVIGLRSIIGTGVTMHNVVMMGADYFEDPSERAYNAEVGRPDIGVGAGSFIEQAIIDKNARIGRGAIIRMLPNRPDEEHENWVARDGIIIVPKNAVIPDGTVI